MRQKRIDNRLYVFDNVPYTLTSDLDAEVVYVQEELFDEYAALNPVLPLKKYNYNVFTVSKQEWYDYKDAEDEIVPQPNNFSPSAALPQEGSEYNFTMFDDDVAGIGIALSPDAATPTITADLAETQSFFESLGASNDSEPDDAEGVYDMSLTISGTLVQDDTVTVTKQGYGQYTFTGENSEIMSVDYSGATEAYIDVSGITEEYGDATAVAIGLSNRQDLPKTDPNIYFDTESVTVEDEGNGYIYIAAPNNPYGLQLSYSTDDPDKGVEYENRDIKITYTTTGIFTVYAAFAGNDYYNSAEASVTVYLNEAQSGSESGSGSGAGSASGSGSGSGSGEQSMSYPVSLIESALYTKISTFEGHILFDNVSGYDSSWMSDLVITLEQNGTYITAGDTVHTFSWSPSETGAVTVHAYINGTEYNGVYYDAFTGSFTLNIEAEEEPPVVVYESYPVSILSDYITSDFDAAADLVSNIDGYDSDWMPEMYITIYDKEDGYNTVYSGSSVSGDDWHGLYTEPSVSNIGSELGSVTAQATAGGNSMGGMGGRP